MQINAHQLTITAHQKLARRLESFGNRLSPHHKRALYEIVKAYSEMASGNRRGRWAFPLFTGGGKTQSIVCWLSAASEMGYLEDISVAVCASRVEALCELKRDLVNVAGIPVEKIGLVHSYRHDPDRDPGSSLPDGFASEPSTDETDDKPILLITHNRVKGKGGIDRFNLYQGNPRTLMIWDESLLKSECKGLREDLIRSAIGWRKPLIKDMNQTRRDAFGYVELALETLSREIERQRKETDTSPRTIRLPRLTQQQVTAYKEVFSYKDISSSVRELLEVSQQDLRVVDTGLQHGGFIQYEVVVDPELENIVILDASHEIRRLSHLDPSIRQVKGYPRDIISYEKVEVFQIPQAGGRGAIQEAFTGKRLLVKEIVHIVQQIPENEAVLFFTFIPRSSWDDCRKRTVYFRDILEKALEKAGIDTKARVLVKDHLGKTVEKQRFCWLTHGNETSLSRYSYTTNQIWAGVLFRSHIDLASQIAGQSEDLLVNIPKETINKVCESELAYCYHQGFSRSACRIVEDGVARPTRIWITFKHDVYRPEDLVKKAMRGIQWQHYEPKFLEVRHQTRIIAQKLRDHLKTVEDNMDQRLCSDQGKAAKVSTRKLKEDMGLQKVPNRTWTRSLNEALVGLKNWTLEGRSVVYQNAGFFGFQN